MQRRSRVWNATAGSCPLESVGHHAVVQPKPTGGWSIQEFVGMEAASSGGLTLRLVAQNVLRMCAMRNNRLVIAVALVYCHRCEPQVSAHSADAALYRQGVAQFGGCDIRDMDVGAHPCLLETCARDGHPAGPIDNSRRHGTVKPAFGVQMVVSDFETSGHGAVCGIYENDVREEEVVDWRVLLDS